MGQNSFFNYSHPDPAIRRELVDLLYTSLPQVMAANITALTGAAALAATTHDAGYVAITCAMLVNAVGRVVSLLRYKELAGRLGDNDLIHWERICSAPARSGDGRCWLANCSDL